MIPRRVSDIKESFARDRDNMLLANFESVRGFETERETLHRPAENSLPNLAPLLADGNFSTNGSNSVAVGIF